MLAVAGKAHFMFRQHCDNTTWRQLQTLAKNTKIGNIFLKFFVSAVWIPVWIPKKYLRIYYMGNFLKNRYKITNILGFIQTFVFK